MLRLALGSVLAVLVTAAQAAQPDEDFPAPGVDLLTTRFVPYYSDVLPPYQLSASVVLIRPQDSAPVASRYGKRYPLLSLSKPKQESVGTTYWQQIYNVDRISLPRLLRLEFKVERLDIALRPNSVSVAGKQFKVTFLSHSALIEGKQIKVMLQSRSASILWSAPF